MLTPRSPARVVISASTPGRSGTGTRISARRSGRTARAGRERRAVAACSSTSSSPARSAPATRSRMADRSASSSVEGGDDGGSVVGAHVGPDAGLPRRDPGHVAEPAGGQPQQRRVLLGGAVGQVHQRGRGQVRDVGDHGHQRVVLLRGQRHHLGPEARHHGLQPGVGVGIGGRRRGEHPGGPHEQLGVGPVDADLLGPGHGVAARRSGDRRAAPTSGAFTPATSVTTAPGRRPARPKAAPTSATTASSGVATKVTSASGSSPTSSSAPRALARSARPGSASCR